MSEEFGFFKATFSKSRNADYHLGCLDGSVFIDFDRTDDDLITLRRLSFDGYGCCELFRKQISSLDITDSQKFILEFNRDKLDQGNISILVKKILALNRKHIWNDALEEYDLI